jgi:hypothetical protein
MVGGPNGHRSNGSEIEGRPDPRLKMGVPDGMPDGGRTGWPDGVPDRARWSARHGQTGCPTGPDGVSNGGQLGCPTGGQMGWPDGVPDEA